MIRDITIGLLHLKGVNTFRQSDGGHGSRGGEKAVVGSTPWGYAGVCMQGGDSDRIKERTCRGGVSEEL